MSPIVLSLPPAQAARGAFDPTFQLHPCPASARPPPISAPRLASTSSSLFASPRLQASLRRQRHEPASHAIRHQRRGHVAPLAIGRGKAQGPGDMNRDRDRDRDSEEGQAQGSFWEGEEGQQKMDEIGQLREIVRERAEIERQLKALEEAQGLDSDAERDLGPEEAAARAEARAEARALKLRELLEKKAQEQTARIKEAQTLFLLGQRAYGKGVYDKCVKILEASLDKVERGSRLGGEIQLWLAMAYDANGQRRQCIDTYKKLEQGHPFPPIRKQAYELRYIAEAPKIKMSPDEILTIPILGTDSQSSQRTWSQMVRERRRPKPMKDAVKTSPDIWNDLEGYTPPDWRQSPYFWVALTLWLTLVGVALVFQD